MRNDITGDEYADQDSAIVLLFKFREAYDDFDNLPGPDEAGELSSWTREVFCFTDQLQEHYGIAGAQRILSRAWSEVKQT